MADTTEQEQPQLLADARRERARAEALDAYIAASEYVFRSTVLDTDTDQAAKPARVKK